MVYSCTYEYKQLNACMPKAKPTLTWDILKTLFTKNHENNGMMDVWIEYATTDHYIDMFSCFNQLCLYTIHSSPTWN